MCSPCVLRGEPFVTNRSRCALERRLGWLGFLPQSESWCGLVLHALISTVSSESCHIDISGLHMVETWKEKCSLSWQPVLFGLELDGSVHLTSYLPGCMCPFLCTLELHLALGREMQPLDLFAYSFHVYFFTPLRYK